MIDWLVPVLLSSFLWSFTTSQLEKEAEKHGMQLVGSEVVQIAFGRWGSLGEAAGSALADYRDTIVLFIAGTLAVQVLVVTVYEVAFVRWCGRTPGKVIFRLTVFPTGASGGRRLAFGQSCVRAGIAVLLPGMAWVLVAVAVLGMSVLPAFFGIVLLVFSIVECLVLRTSPEGRTTWHDRRSRSVVVPMSWTAQLQQMRWAQQRMVEQGWVTAQQVWQAAPTQKFVQQANSAYQRMQGSDAAARVQQRGQDIAGYVRDSGWGQAMGNRVRDFRQPATGQPAQPPVTHEHEQ